MSETFSREVLLVGKAAFEKLQNAHVCLFGLGGVGGAAFEALVRAGVGSITVVDGDCVEESNLNRQILATESTLGMPKVQVAAERARQINPNCRVTPIRKFFLPENAADIDFSQFDYVADAIDTVTAKLEIAMRAQEAGIPAISCMGTGNKLDPSAFEVADISRTSVCPLARVMRLECRKRGIKKLKCVFSKEQPQTRQRTPASISFVPPAAGLLMAGEIIKDIAL